MAFILLTSLLAACICYVDGQSACLTPGGDAGTCKSIHQCDALLDLVQKKDRTSEDTELLKKYHCGFQDNTPSVCCPNQCYTPEGQAGKCTNIDSCPHLAKMQGSSASQENMQYLRNSRCQDSDQNSVCCGPPPDPNPIPTGNCAAKVSAFPPDPRSECCGRDSTGGNQGVAAGPTKINQYPWLAMIEYLVRRELRQLCIGSLISGKYVLTSAHCVSAEVLRIAEPKNVRLGEYDTTSEGPDCVSLEAGGIDCTEGDLVIPIEKLIPHPEYRANNQRKWNDIGLIRMQRTAPYTDFIRPICLPSVDLTLTPPTNFTMIAGTWGNAEKENSKTRVKSQVDLPFVNMETCQADFYSGKRMNTELWRKQLCAGGVVGKDTCRGDGGSPLMYETERTFEVLGITSFGPVPCGQGIPSVYTKVYEYNTWIRRTIEP